MRRRAGNGLPAPVRPELISTVEPPAMGSSVTGVKNPELNAATANGSTVVAYGIGVVATGPPPSRYRRVVGRSTGPRRPGHRRDQTTGELGGAGTAAAPGDL